MLKLPDTHHLLKRNGIWYYRRRTPPALIAHVGAKIIKHSLRTKDKRVAIKLREALDIEWSAREAAALRGGLVPNALVPVELAPAPPRPPLEAAQIRAMVRDYLDRIDERAECRFLADPPSSEEERLSLIQDAELGMQGLQNRDDPNGHQRVSRAIADVLGDDHADAPANAYEVLRQALLQYERRRAARYAGELELRSTYESQKKSPYIPTFGEIAQNYIELREAEGYTNRASAKGLDKIRTNAALIRELVGDRTPITEVSFDVCMSVRRTLDRVPANLTKLYSKMPISQAIEAAAAKGDRTLAPITQRQYLGALSQILSHAVRRGILHTNPAYGMRPLRRDEVLRRDKRLPLSFDQIAQLFCSPFYQSCAEHGRQPYLRDSGGWR